MIDRTGHGSAGGNRRWTAAAIVLGIALVGGRAFAQSADVTYVQGSVDLQPTGQPRGPAMIGDAMNPGDSIITGQDGLAQLQKASLADITVSPGTVFTLRQVADANGTKRDVLAVSLGSLAFKFNELGGKEPLIATASAIAGIRGTQLKVYAGADGSSLFVVQSGKVVVSGTGGKSVDLTADQGVEVNPGQPVGQKIKVIYGKIDFKTWNNGKLDSMLKDPESAARGVERRLEDYIVHINELAPKFRHARETLVANRAKLPGIKRKQGESAMQSYYDKYVKPYEGLSSSLYINLSYYVLSSLSLRRFVMARMYVRLSTMYITDPENVVYQRFLSVYRGFVRKYEKSVTPQLAPGAI